MIGWWRHEGCTDAGAGTYPLAGRADMQGSLALQQLVLVGDKRPKIPAQYHRTLPSRRAAASLPRHSSSTPLTMMPVWLTTLIISGVPPVFEPTG
jgi:hypothetical protein